jgi:hypothetical protein
MAVPKFRRKDGGYCAAVPLALKKHRQWANIGYALGTFSGELHGSFLLGAPLYVLYTSFPVVQSGKKRIQTFKAHFCKVVSFAA